MVSRLHADKDHFERSWKIINPNEIGVLVELCELLKSHCTGFSIGLESTGTYGDVVRYAFSGIVLALRVQVIEQKSTKPQRGDM